MRRPDGASHEGERRFEAHAMNNAEHPRGAATTGSTPIVARRARPRIDGGYAARRGTLLTSTLREACHAS
jgi:hypothetical protein